MELAADILVPGNRKAVWNHLIDSEVLRRCIPGCNELERSSDTEFVGKMSVKVGPVSATFTGTVCLDEMEEPVRCVLTGQGKGGPAGFVKGSALIVLNDEGGQTRLSYVAQVQIGGKLAAVGNRLFGSVAKRNIDDFFVQFGQIMRDAEAAAA